MLLEICDGSLQNWQDSYPEEEGFFLPAPSLKDEDEYNEDKPLGLTY